MTDFFIRLAPFAVPGIIYGIGAVGVALVFRYLKFPDFTSVASIVTGGIVGVYVTNHLGPWPGLLCGAVAGGTLGLATSWLTCALHIQPVLAGIITFIASFTPCHLLAEGGTVELADTSSSFLQPVYCTLDAIWVLCAAAFVCLFVAYTMKTHLGSLLLAMTADEEFVRYRHTCRNTVFVAALFLGNAIVGFAGALYGLRAHSAQVPCHAEFLPFSIGSIFAGTAVLVWLSRRFRTEDKVPNGTPSFLDDIRRFLRPDREESGTKMAVLFFSYVLSCFLLMLISGAVQADVLTVFHPFLHIPTDLHWLVSAAVIAVFVWRANVNE